MSAAVRAQLAEAASTVSGVNVAPYYAQGTAPGHGHIRRERTAWPNKFGAVVSWNVIIVLPQGMAAAERYLDEVQPELVAALAPHLTIVEAVPQRLNITGVGDLPCLFINGHREE